MSLWEYKHITSGPHGFATPALLESYLNQLGKDEWEVVSYQVSPTNPLAFNGLARRTTLRDWTLESAAAAAAKVEADKLRAEFAAKFAGAAPAAGAAAGGEAGAEKPESIVAEAAAGDDGLRKLRDTERDGDPDAQDEGDDWDSWDGYEDDLPTFFEAIKPHLRKNQRGPGQSVGITFLAKRWEQTEADMVGALRECGFTIPEREDDAPVYLEFEGELYWLNLNSRHELFLNTREKPRPVFRVAQAKPLDPGDPAAALLAEEAAAEQAEKAKREAERLAREAEHAARRAEHEARRAAQQAAAQAAREAAAAAKAAASAEGGEPKAEDGRQRTEDRGQKTEDGGRKPEAPAAPEGPLPEGEELLKAIRSQMRRNRRGPGYSGSTSYLARAFKHTEADLVAALARLGLNPPENPNEKPVKTTIGSFVYWLNKDSRGGIWINGDEARGPKPAVQAEDGGPGTEDRGQSTEGGALPAAGAEASGEVAGVPVVPASEVTPQVVAKPVVEAAPAQAGQSGHAGADAKAEESVVSEAVAAPAPAPVSSGVPAGGFPKENALSAMRLLLKPNKRGSGVSAQLDYLAETLGQERQAFLALVGELGLALPPVEGEKPTFVEHGDEIFWLNKNPKDGSVWLNAKQSKAGAKKAAAGGEAKAPKPRARRSAKAEKPEE